MWQQVWHPTLTKLFYVCNISLCLSGEVLATDQALLRKILENHILKLKITLSELYNGQLLETLAGKLLRVFIYRTVRTACVCVCVCCASNSMRNRKQNRSGGKECCFS